ncbi:MAG TPA: hypothetical protein VF624_08450 [Tepidisphaeraceae bacterium]|jgi:hypothetical protein
MPVPFLEEIDALNASGVDFVVVGGVAVILHGHVARRLISISSYVLTARMCTDW